MLIEVEHRSFEETLARCEALGGADLLFFSPPYPTEKPGAKGREGAPTRRYGGDTPEHFLWEDYQRLGDCSYRALKPGGFCIIIIDGPVRFTRSKKIGSERSLIAFKLAIDWAERVGFRYVEHEAYLRESAPGDFSPRRRSGWEPMHIFQRPGARGFFDGTAITLPAINANKDRKICSSRMWSGKHLAPSAVVRERHIMPPVRRLTTALTAIPSGPNIHTFSIDSEHQAPFTHHIAKVQVLSYSPPGGLVCDPFNGSGTTGIAAVKNGRSFVGGDLGARERDGRRWADVGRERALEPASLPPQSVRPSESSAVESAAPAAEQMPLLIA